MTVLSFYDLVFQFLTIGNPDAVNDIIRNPMFAGSLESLSWIIQVCDSWFGLLVSFCGFFIMSAAMLKNAIAGMYASNTKLFDKVNQVKNDWVTTADGKVHSVNSRFIRGVGPIAVFLLRLLPDPKEISEFKDDNISPRDYFLKAIPQMIGVAMIGVVIYNGYYRDVLGQTANLGCAIIEKFLLDVDPVEGLNKMLGWASQPDLASAQDDSMSGELTEKIASEMYHSIVSFYTDQDSTGVRNSIAATVESWASNQVISNCQPYLDESKWKYSVKVTRILNEPNLANIAKTGDEQVVQAWSFPISSLSLDTAKHTGEDWWLRVIVVWSRVREDVKTSMTGVVTDGTLLMPNANVVNETVNGSKQVLIRMDKSKASCFIAKSAKVDGNYTLVITDKGLVIKGATRDILGLENGVNVSGLYYAAGDNKAYVKTLQIKGNTYMVSSSKGDVEVGQSFNLTTTTSGK